MSIIELFESVSMTFLFTFTIACVTPFGGTRGAIRVEFVACVAIGCPIIERICQLVTYRNSELTAITETEYRTLTLQEELRGRDESPSCFVLKRLR
jgi:hypothetical protein